MVLPPEDPHTLGRLAQLLDADAPVVALTAPDGRFVRLPVEVCRALAQVVGAMGAGQAVSVQTVKSTLTPQETADFLGMSRLETLALLESGQIPFERPAVGRHRRVQLRDVVNYLSRRAQERTMLFRQAR